MLSAVSVDVCECASLFVEWFMHTFKYEDSLISKMNYNLAYEKAKKIQHKVTFYFKPTSSVICVECAPGTLDY